MHSVYIHACIIYTHTLIYTTYTYNMLYTGIYLSLDLDHVVEDEVGQHRQGVVAHHHITIVQSIVYSRCVWCIVYKAVYLMLGV